MSRFTIPVWHVVSPRGTEASGITRVSAAQSLCTGPTFSSPSIEDVCISPRGSESIKHHSWGEIPVEPFQVDSVSFWDACYGPATSQRAAFKPTVVKHHSGFLLRPAPAGSRVRLDGSLRFRIG